jgi:hypothetical protein
MVGKLRHSSFCGACRHVLGDPLGRLQILRQVASIVESIEAMVVGDHAIKQCVYMILELIPYRSKRHFMPNKRGVERTDLLMLERVSRVHARCALGHSEAVRAVPRYPPGRVSFCDMISSEVLPTRTFARRDCNASSLCALVCGRGGTHR